MSEPGFLLHSFTFFKEKESKTKIEKTTQKIKEDLIWETRDNDSLILL